MELKSLHFAPGIAALRLTGESIFGESMGNCDCVGHEKNAVGQTYPEQL